MYRFSFQVGSPKAGPGTVLEQNKSLEALERIIFSPFQDKSPVKFLKDFYNNARHLDDELAMSAVGRLLGAAELGGTAKEEEILS